MNNHSTLFVDESGKQTLAENVDDPFILTGVILNDEEIDPVEGFFDYIKIKYSIPKESPFHSYELFEKPATKLSDGQASALMEMLADFISLIPIKIKVISIDKKEFWKALGVGSINDFKGSAKKHELKNFPYQIMSSVLFEWFAKYLKSQNKIGEIIVDARKGGDEKLIKSLEICKEKDGPLPKYADLIKERCTAICFAQKTFLSGGLEITDLISFTSFFHARRLMTQMDNIKLHLVWQEIKTKLTKEELHHLNIANIKSFFKIKKGELHPFLIDKNKKSVNPT